MKVGFVSDIHEDISNLELSFRILEKENCEKVFCLGDIVGFAFPFYKNISTKDANACIKLIKSNCETSVVGNHDLYAIKKLPVHKAGFDYPSNWYLLDYETRAKLSKNKIWLYEDNEIPCLLNDESIEFLDKLNEKEIVSISGKNIFLSHFCFPDFTGSHIHFPSEGFHLKNHFEQIKESGCSFSFSGHGHPEGCLCATTEKINSIKFGLHQLKNELQWIVVPAVANTSRKNGVMIFDSELNQVKTVSI